MPGEMPMTDTRPYRFLNEAGYTEALLGWQPDEELFLIPRSVRLFGALFCKMTQPVA